MKRAAITIILALLFVAVCRLTGCSASAAERQEPTQFVVQSEGYYNGVKLFTVVPMRPAVLIVQQEGGDKSLGKLDVLSCKPSQRVRTLEDTPVTEGILVCGNGVTLVVKGISYP